MNLLLVDPKDVSQTGEIYVHGRQLLHILKTLKSRLGDNLTIGLRNGQIGTGEITLLTDKKAILLPTWQSEPPEPIPLKLVIALPRPKMLRRIIQNAVSMGVKDIVFINAWKVEKSYWQSPWLEPPSLEENAVLGLEQSKDTRMPRIALEPLFKPFVEDRLAEFSASTRRLVAHPGGNAACPSGMSEACTLAIGPEGGFTPYEIEKLVEQGFKCVTLGPRILRVETAVPALIARLFH